MSKQEKSLEQNLGFMQFGNGDYANRLQMFWHEFDEMQKAWFWIRYQQAIKMFEITKDPKIGEWLMKWDVEFRTRSIIAANNNAKKEEAEKKLNDAEFKNQELEQKLKQREALYKKEQERSERLIEMEKKLKERNMDAKRELEEKRTKLKELESKTSSTEHQEPVRRLSRG